MGQDQVVPTKMRDQSVTGCEIDPDRPFFGADIAGSGGKPGFESVQWFCSVLTRVNDASEMKCSCHCEKRSNDAISSCEHSPGRDLLRFARNDAQPFPQTGVNIGTGGPPSL